MPLKPIYGKSPLTQVAALPLRPGQVRMDDAHINTVYQMLKNTGKDTPAVWEAALRLACVLCAKPDAEPVFAWVKACADAQAEDGALSANPADGLSAACAMMAAYEYSPDRALLETMMRWCAWAQANWQQVMACNEIRAHAGDMMALLCQLYRITGKKGLLNLCGLLRQDSMNWSGVLHAFSVQRPMKRVMRQAELQEGMDAEQHNEAGFYTRQYLTCHGEALADGARASVLSSVYSGSGYEADAAKTGWEKISRWHGAVCGGVTADETLGGQNPSCAVDAAALGAWVEAFAAQMMLKESAWAGDALERILCNGLPAALAGGQLVPYQRVNSINSVCSTRDCYMVREEQEQAVRAAARLAGGYAAAVHSAITTTAQGAQVNLYMPGSYTIKLGETTVRLDVTGADGEYDIALVMKQPVKAKLQLRTPAWTSDAFININDEGGYEGKNGEYLSLEREWKRGDVIHVRFARSLQVEECYHQSACIRYGAQVMAVPADETNWAYALCGAPEVREGKVYAKVARVAGWKAAHGVPGDMPVCPETAGDAIEIEMKPYAAAARRMAVLPKGAKA